MAEINGYKVVGDTTRYAMEMVKYQDKIEKYWTDYDKKYILYWNDLYHKDPNIMPSPTFGTEENFKKYIFSHKLSMYTMYNMVEVAKRNHIPFYFSDVGV